MVAGPDGPGQLGSPRPEALVAAVELPDKLGSGPAEAGLVAAEVGGGGGGGGGAPADGPALDPSSDDSQSSTTMREESGQFFCQVCSAHYYQWLGI